MTIHDVKNDPILIVSGQEPSMPIKYVLQGQGVFDTLLIMLESWNLAHKWKITHKMNHDDKDDPFLQVPGQEISTFSKYELQGWGVIDTYLTMP